MDKTNNTKQFYKENKPPKQSLLLVDKTEVKKPKTEVEKPLFS